MNMHIFVGHIQRNLMLFPEVFKISVKKIT
jgi:hypothetical protein